MQHYEIPALYGIGQDRTSYALNEVEATKMGDRMLPATASNSDWAGDDWRKVPLVGAVNASYLHQAKAHSCAGRSILTNCAAIALSTSPPCCHFATATNGSRARWYVDRVFHGLARAFSRSLPV